MFFKGKRKNKYIVYRQLDQSDCGPTCLRMVAKYHGKNYNLEFLRNQCYIKKGGVSLSGISHAAERIGMHSLAVSVPFETLKEAPLPCIAHWRQRHFVVIYEISDTHVIIGDPGHGLLKYEIAEFLDGWHGHPRNIDHSGIVLLLEPGADFGKDVEDMQEESRMTFSYLLSYLRPYKKLMLQLGLGLVLGVILQLIFPFLTQAIVDRGIEYQDIGFVNTILLAQLMLFLSTTAVKFIRSWILLHISTRINISLISDFLTKLMRLPISFFDSRVVGDILQRINDHRRIEAFLTSSTLNVLFSMVNLIVFGFVLAIFNIRIFLIFIISALLYIIWVTLFLRKRRELDFKAFDRLSDNQTHLVQIVHAMPDIKLNNSEQQKRWEWERIQARLFKVKVEGLALSQYQEVGAFFINNFKDILITFIAAKAVIEGQMTLGTMLAIQYIVGQVNVPLQQLIGFIQTTQDAKISFDRLSEIRVLDDEEPTDMQRLHELPRDRSIVFKNVNFTYGAPTDPMVIDDLTMVIPQGKVTAIVGASGSGKTTLLKLLLKFYNPNSGNIYLGNSDLKNFHANWWRSQCGVVMQDGYIYSDTVANNITIGDESVDRNWMMESARLANIQSFIEDLPLGYQTKIGAEGIGLSQGQKQRILIARAIYKRPDFLLFDEATSALDAKNEKEIMQHLEQIYQGKTVVVVAHRLSTVKNADQIIVLDKGKIVEVGNHTSLSQAKGYYYRLVKDQLELGA